MSTRPIVGGLTAVAILLAAALLAAPPQAVQAQTPNNVPVFPAGSATELDVPEHSPPGTLVGDPFMARDADNDTITFTLSGADAGDFAIGASSGQLAVGAATILDYETKHTYTVTVVATDTENGSTGLAVTIRLTNAPEAGLPGTITITVGNVGDDYGYSAGAYGSVSGNFHPELFTDGVARIVSGFREQASGDWELEYTGGASEQWLMDAEALNDMTLTVTYADEDDTQYFVLGSHITGRSGGNALRVKPWRADWEERAGETVTIQFHRRTTFATHSFGAVVEEPEDATGFIGWLVDTTPGGGVVAQMAIVLMVYGGFMFSPMTRPGLSSLMMGAVVLVLTPWATVILGFGDALAAAAITLNVGGGAWTWKMLFARTEA